MMPSNNNSKEHSDNNNNNTVVDSNTKIDNADTTNDAVEKNAGDSTKSKSKVKWEEN